MPRCMFKNTESISNNRKTTKMNNISSYLYTVIWKKIWIFVSEILLIWLIKCKTTKENSLSLTIS